MGIMFADVNDVFFGHDLRGVDGGVNQVGRWMNNLPFPKKLLMFFFGPSTSIDWTPDRPVLPGREAARAGCRRRVGTADARDRPPRPRRPGAAPERVFHAGGSGERRPARDRISPEPAGEHRALRVVERGGGRDPPPRAWLYDQPPAPLALTREGRWRGQQPDNAATRSAARLVAFVSKAQKPDGHWARVWSPRTGAELADDRWVGDQAWMVIALAQYASRAGSANAAAAAERGARGIPSGRWSRPGGRRMRCASWTIAPRRHRMGCGSALLVVRLREIRASRWTWPRGRRPSPAIRWSTAPGEAWTRSGSCAGPW